MDHLEPLSPPWVWREEGGYPYPWLEEGSEVEDGNGSEEGVVLGVGGVSLQPQSESYTFRVPDGLINGLVNIYGHQPGVQDLREGGEEEKTIEFDQEDGRQLFEEVISSIEFGHGGGHGDKEEEDGQSLGGGGGGDDGGEEDGRIPTPNPPWDNGSSIATSPSPTSSSCSLDYWDEEEIDNLIIQIQEQLELEEQQAKEEQLRQDAEFAYQMQLNEYDNAKDLEFREIVEREVVVQNRLSEQLEKNKDQKLTMAQTIRCSQLREMFPNLEDVLIDDAFRQSEMNFDKTANLLKDIFPSKFVDKGDAPGLKPVTEIQGGKDNNLIQEYDPELVAKMTANDKLAMDNMVQHWKEEYQRCTEECKRAREDAEKHKSGGGAVAAATAMKYQKASLYGHRARSAYDKLSFYYLMSNNAGNKNPNKIDLHGQTVNKAAEIVRKYLANRKAWGRHHVPNNQTLMVSIITGIGKHSEGPARLEPVVRQFLLDNHYRFSDEKRGIFHVRLYIGTDKDPYLSSPSSQKQTRDHTPTASRSRKGKGKGKSIRNH